MPLTYIKTTPDYTIAIWQVTEDLELLSQKLTIDQRTAITLKTCKDHRRRELIGTRHLLNYMLADTVTITKSDHGRPMIEEFPDLHLSLSHSGDSTAIMLSKRHERIGIDIQIHRENITKLALKFMTPTEVASTSMAQQHYYWGIKESVFKAWSQGGVDFKKMIKITPFTIMPETTLQVKTPTLFTKNEELFPFMARGLRLKDLYITWVIPQS